MERWTGNQDIFKTYVKGRSAGDGKKPAEKVKGRDHISDFSEVCDEDCFGAILNTGFIDISFDTKKCKKGVKKCRKSQKFISNISIFRRNQLKVFAIKFSIFIVVFLIAFKVAMIYKPEKNDTKDGYLANLQYLSSSSGAEEKTTLSSVYLEVIGIDSISYNTKTDKTIDISNSSIWLNERQVYLLYITIASMTVCAMIYLIIQQDSFSVTFIQVGIELS